MICGHVLVSARVRGVGEWEGIAHPLLILFLELLLVLGYEKATKCAGVGKILQNEGKIAVSSSRNGSKEAEFDEEKGECTFDRRSRLPKKRWTLLLMARWAGAGTVQAWSRTATSIQWCEDAKMSKRAAGYV